MSSKLVILFALASAAFAQESGRLIAPGSTFSDELVPGESRIYKVELPPGATLTIRIAEQQGMAGIVAMLDAHGRELLHADLRQRLTSAKALLVPLGTTQLVIRAASHSPLERKFEVHAGEIHALGDADRSRLAADTLLGQGELAFAAEKPNFREDANTAWEKSLEIWTRLGDRARQVDTLIKMGRARYALNEMKAAADLYQKALDLAVLEKDAEGEAAGLYGKALVAGDTGGLNDAEKWGKQALEIRQSLGDVRGQPELLLVLFGVTFTRGKTEESRELAAQAASLAQRSGDRLREADAYNFRGVLESQLGNRKEAFLNLNRALAMAREEDDPVRAAQALANIATEYGKSGDNRQALRNFAEALPIRKTLSTPASYANTLYNMSVNQRSLGEYDQALNGFREALAIFRQIRSPRGEGFTLRELGELYLSIGDSGRAEQYFLEAAAKWRAISDRRGEVLALNSLADLDRVRGRVSKAQELLTQALATARTANLLHEQAISLLALARCALAAGDAAGAMEYASQARVLNLTIPDEAGEADSEYQQGLSLARLGDTAEANAAFGRALRINQQLERKLYQSAALEAMARLDRDREEIVRAREEIDQAIDLMKGAGPTPAKIESRMQFSASHRSTFDLAIDIRMRMGDTAGAFELSEQARAQGLATLLREPVMDIREGVDPDLLRRERDLGILMDAKQDQLAKLLAGPHNAARETEVREDLNEVVEHYRDAESEIRSRSPRFAALVEPQTISAAQVQSRLIEPGTALISYWLGTERSYAWVITKKDVSGFVLPSRERIEGAARRTYAALDARNIETSETPAERNQRLQLADRDFDRSAAEMSAMLFGPIGSFPRSGRLWIISDGALEYLPFAALPMPGTHECLTAAHEIVRLPSASVMAEMKSELAARRPARLSVAVLADPVFRADDERLGTLASKQAGDPPRAVDDVDLFRLPRLYFSRREADAVAALGGPGKAREIVDFDATRSAAKNPALRDYRIIHFATHALLDSKNPELSGLVLSMVDRRGRPQDGFLRLHEVYSLKLNADLVVLSACKTALGPQVQSEGLIGLTRGFMYAGAPQVLASLWSIRDNATAAFMTKFYEALLERHERPETALRTAQLDMMKDPHWSHPYYWAAFTMQGAR